MSISGPRRVGILVLSTCLLASLPRIAHAAAPPCLPIWTSVPSNGPRPSTLFGVAALSRTDAWAVGFRFAEGGGSATLAQHWDGASWTVTPTPNLGNADVLEDVAAISSNDAWAVGLSFGKGPLIEHWNGAKWSRFDATGFPALNDVAAVAANDVWAVGHHWATESGEPFPGIVHWDGTSWSLYPTPTMPRFTDPVLHGIDIVSADDIWAVGQYLDGPAMRTLVVHWDGESWSILPSPMEGSLKDVSAVSANDVWAVGSHGVIVGDRAVPEFLMLHWDGAQWTDESPDPVAVATELYGVAAVASGDVWAVGLQENGNGTGGLIEHWDGTAWLSVAGYGANLNRFLHDVEMASPREIWAVGQIYARGAPGLINRICPVLVADGGFSPRAPRSARGYDVAWSIVSTGGPHSVTDRSGMGLFDSGVRSPGNSYTHGFTASGMYAVVDTVTGQTGTINIPVTVGPVRGSLATRFRVTWSTKQAPAGFVFDVQIKRPGSSSFVTWKLGTKSAWGFFKAKRKGYHYFRARLRKPSIKKATGWSTPAKFRVV